MSCARTQPTSSQTPHPQAPSLTKSFSRWCLSSASFSISWACWSLASTSCCCRSLCLKTLSICCGKAWWEGHLSAAPFCREVWGLQGRPTCRDPSPLPSLPSHSDMLNSACSIAHGPHVSGMSTSQPHLVSLQSVLGVQRDGIGSQKAK